VNQAAANPSKAVRPRAQRTRILDVPHVAFAERGFNGGSIAAIAEAAAMSQG
jgi:AcrR family transcriptional regulator